ncbi:MAG: DUF4124 domain-containing protein [Zoogloeaceae bacterium]|jgi:hypothetical protein|nr:DUF4124 domain-containing protein [Zoogloeaceae bacterium]
MQIRLILPVLCVLALALPAQAEVYKWKDASGNTVISDTPQPGAGKPVKPVEGVTPAASAEGAAANATPKSVADQELELKKRQQEQKEAADKADKDKVAADAKKANCDRAKQHLTLMQSGERAKRMLENGQTEYISDQQRQQEIETARRSMQANCN